MDGILYFSGNRPSLLSDNRQLVLNLFHGLFTVMVALTLEIVGSKAGSNEFCVIQTEQLNLPLQTFNF